MKQYDGDEDKQRVKQHEGSIDEPEYKSASHAVSMHDHVQTRPDDDSLKTIATNAEWTSHESDNHSSPDDTVDPLIDIGPSHDKEGAELMSDSRDPVTTHNHVADGKKEGIAHTDKIHGMDSHVQDLQILDGDGGKPVMHSEEMHCSNVAGFAPQHGVKQEGTANEMGLQECDDDSEFRKAFSDENSSKERVHFSRATTPDVDTPTHSTGSAFKNPKPIKAVVRLSASSERGPGSTEGNPETPPTTWAFSTRASIAPSKFDHMATLKMTYATYKESNLGKEGVPLSLLPEILESARFMVPPPRDLVPLLQRIDPEYKSGDLVRWSLLQNLALQIERKETRYPSVFVQRCSVARPNSSSPSSWKALQRSPSRRTHPEDDCPELEPQVYEMMKEIDNRRRKSAKEGNYLAADAAAQRLLELKLFEDNKRRATMLERHAQEREQAEKAYKEELQERNQLWDERLKSFQKEVVEHAQRLKQQHVAALQHFKEKMSSKTPIKAQWSRELLKQRRIQSYLGKQGKYLEAQEVKQSADRMEQAELQAAIAAFQSDVIGKEQTIRVKQQTEMDILLQRAARTREEIRKSRTLDLQRCHQRHKNVMRELAAIQKQEVFRFDQLMQKKVQNPYTGIGFGGQRLSQSPSSRAHFNAVDYSTDDACGSGGEDSSMKG
ncbi:hypothetical protein KP509_28G060900 [Ceratopteris richardii]|uniref:Uncharacterized protein n=1 Tax=Ceratopteris richardii TaxID=49495 RepID=A0A8T2RFC4_CERRI|nr:hypothetical protein KP509_28G060900 [Ceratopteris richardii]KAH7294213.1 hypothetical protein KP509_28G060900 [Ceratopteris richardii]